MTSPSNPGIRLAELAQYVQGRVQGNADLVLTGVASLEEAQPGDLAFIANAKHLEAGRRSKASALVVNTPVPGDSRPQLLVDHPPLAFARIVQRYFGLGHPPPGLSPHLVRGADVRIGPDVSIGPFVTLGDRVRIGARVVLYPGVYIGDDAEIGDDTILYPHVAVLQGCALGARVIVHSGTVIGSDGFGYLQHQGQHLKIPQVGSVLIEDDVELGANVTVDRATLGRTIIKRGTKIDNQVQVAHNVRIGEHCILVAQVGIAGSTTVGNYVMIGGQAGLVDHLSIGDQAKIAAGSGVTHNLEPGQAVGGRPAFDYTAWLKAQALVHKLPELRKEMRALQARIEELERHTSLERSHPRKST